jgi:hypothetical protein
VQPWELRLADPSHSRLTDRVVSVRAERGGLLVRTERFTVQIASVHGYSVREGALIGLSVAPADVRLLADDSQVLRQFLRSS